MDFLESPTRNLLFTGKGGVGKTTMACASAVRLADRGRRVLLVSTDPASNLSEVLETSIASVPTPAAAVPNLWAMNIDPEQAASEYRERMVGPYRGILPEAAIASMEEQFSGSCTLEIAAFDEFAKLLGDDRATSAYDHVIFDTAPTGHTLRLLTLPSAWSDFIETNTSGTSCLGPLAGLQAQQEIYSKSVQSLGDAVWTTLFLVSRPEPSALREAGRTSAELRQIGVGNQRLILNGTFRATDAEDSLALAMQARCEKAVASMPESIANLARASVPLSSTGLVGIDSLRSLGSDCRDEPAGHASLDAQESISVASETAASMEQLIDDLAEQGHGVVLTMGKGGVGKTTLAAAVAVALAERGCQVHLSTTDPASHIAQTLAKDGSPGLSVSRIDPAGVTAAYRREVMESAGAMLDDKGRALLEEDLRSPCTEEIAVFRAFAEVVARGEQGFVVLDTAPTGHTILLLDSALAYHREVTRQSTEMPESVQRLLPRLRDPGYTRILVVTLAESTPVHEAARLQSDLRRAEIEPYAWVINQALTPVAVTDPLLRSRKAAEKRYIDEVRSRHSERMILIPWQAEPPVGILGLRELIAFSAGSGFRCARGRAGL